MKEKLQKSMARFMFIFIIVFLILIIPIVSAVGTYPDCTNLSIGYNVCYHFNNNSIVGENYSGLSFNVFNSINYSGGDFPYYDNSNNGTAFNVTYINQGSTTNDGYLTFNGNTSMINISGNFNNTLAMSSNFSISVWVMTFDNDISKNKIIFSFINNTNSRICLDIDDYVRFGYYNGSAVNPYNAVSMSGSPMAKGIWTYVVVNHYGNQSNEMFINGVKQTGNSGPPSPGTTFLNPTIGSGINGKFPFNGSIDEFIIINRTLTQSEVTNYYQSYAFPRSYTNNFRSFNYTFNPDSIFVDWGLNLTYINNIESRSFETKKDGTLYVYNRTTKRVLKSLDYGNNWIIISPVIEAYSSRKMFIDSYGDIFLDGANNGTLWMSNGNDTNWTSIFNYTCGINGSAWSMTEDTLRNKLYFGQYCYCGYNENCSYIFESSNRGISWNISYNSSKDSPFGGRHIHNIKYNPYNNYIYATQGDSVNNSGIFRYNGINWEWILNYTNRISKVDNFITIDFLSNKRIFGEDVGNNGIWTTLNDLNYNFSYTPRVTESGSFWTSSKDILNNIFFGTYINNVGNYPILLMTFDGGISYNTVFTDNVSNADDSIFTISSFNNNNISYFYSQGKIVKFNSRNYTNPQFTLSFKNKGNNITTISYSNLNNALLFTSNGSGVIASGNYNITISPNNYSYILDNFNLTEGTIRDNSPIYFSSATTTSKTISTNLKDEIVSDVIINMEKCNTNVPIKVSTSSTGKTCISGNQMKLSSVSIPTQGVIITISRNGLGSPENPFNAGFWFLFSISGVLVMSLIFVATKKVLYEGMSFESYIKLITIILVFSMIGGMLLFTIM